MDAIATENSLSPENNNPRSKITEVLTRLARLPQTLISRFRSQTTSEEGITGSMEISSDHSDSTVVREIVSRPSDFGKNHVERQREKRERYLAWQIAQEAQEAETSKKQKTRKTEIEEIPFTDEEITETEITSKIEILPTDKTIELKRDELLWLPESEQISLSLVRMNNGAVEFYLGDGVRGNRLLKVIDEIQVGGQTAAIDSLFFKQIEKLIQTGNRRYINQLTYPRTKVKKIPIFKINGTENKRVYYIRMKNIDNKYVIIRVAACTDVTTENNVVMQVITTKRIKK